jgi:hypothetical protein
MSTHLQRLTGRAFERPLKAIRRNLGGCQVVVSRLEGILGKHLAGPLCAGICVVYWNLYAVAKFRLVLGLSVLFCSAIVAGVLQLLREVMHTRDIPVLKEVDVSVACVRRYNMMAALEDTFPGLKRPEETVVVTTRRGLVAACSG